MRPDLPAWWVPLEGGVWLVATALMVAGLATGSWWLVGLSAWATTVGLLLGRGHRVR